MKKRAKAVREALYVCHDAQAIRIVLEYGMKRPVAVIVDAADLSAPGAVRQIQDELFAVLAEEGGRAAKAKKPRRAIQPGRAA